MSSISVNLNPQLETLPAQTVSYTFISVFRAVGFSAIPDKNASVFTDDGVDVAFVDDPTEVLRPIDERGAIAELLLRAVFRGEQTGDDIRAAVDERIAHYVSQRGKAHTNPGVYLVVKVAGAAYAKECKGRDIGIGVLAIEAVDKREIAASRRALVSAYVTAASISAERTSPEVIKVSEGVCLSLANGRPFYSITFESGQLGLQTSRKLGDEDVESIAKLAMGLMANAMLATPARLLADAVARLNERLEAFILAWAALEILTKKATAGCQNGEWVSQVSTSFRDSASELRDRIQANVPAYYGLADRVRVYGMLYGLDNFEALALETNDIRKTYREPLFHEGALREAGLPVERVLGIVSCLLKGAVGNSCLAKGGCA
jgi:hypothetical protein